ncbi:MAG TPA: tetratricopeptide repeat protein [Myxococcaceae bacterium]|nr:tetratricopeptide repeat protein [Myxococcaceae bacterium]
MRSFRGGFAAVLLAVLASASAWGAQSPVRRYLRSAATFYDKLDFDRALEQARKAESHSSGPEDDVEIALVEGILLANIGKEDDADAAFRRGLSLQPDAKLPYKSVSPKISELFEKVRGEVKKALTRTPTPEEVNPPPPVVEKPPPMVEKPGPVVTTSVEQPSRGVRRFAWIPLVAGVALGGAGAYAYSQSESRFSSLEGGNIPLATANQYKSEGPTYQTAALILAGAGAAALITSGVMFFAGAPSTQVTLAPAPNGVVVVGSFP